MQYHLSVLFSPSAFELLAFTNYFPFLLQLSLSLSRRLSFSEKLALISFKFLYNKSQLFQSSDFQFWLPFLTRYRPICYFFYFCLVERAKAKQRKIWSKTLNPLQFAQYQSKGATFLASKLQLRHFFFLISLIGHSFGAFYSLTTSSIHPFTEECFVLWERREKA